MKYFTQHKYDVNIIDIYFTLYEMYKYTPLIKKYKNIIKYLIESNGSESEDFFKSRFPYILYSDDNSYELFLALKLISSKEYLIEPILNFQYEYARKKETFINKLEFLVLENIDNNNFPNNKMVLEITIKWITSIRNKHNYKYISEHNPLYFNKKLNQKEIKKSYVYPIHITNINNSDFFNIFKTELFFDLFLKTLIKLKIIDNKCNWIAKEKQSKVIVNYLHLKGENILDIHQKVFIAKTLIDFFKIKYSSESARKSYKDNDSNNELYNNLNQNMEELLKEIEK